MTGTGASSPILETRAQTAAARPPPWSPCRPSPHGHATPQFAARRPRGGEAHSAEGRVRDRVGAGLQRRRRREAGRRGHGWGGTPVGRLRAGGGEPPEHMKFCVSRDGSAHGPKQRTAGVKGGCWGKVGSGRRYQVLSHVFARCASQKTHGHARI